MANIVDVEIITPDRVFYSGKATMIEFNTTEGEIGVLPNHIALTTVIAPGIVTISTEEEQIKAAVHAGFAEIAEWPDEIDVKRAHAAEERARERLEKKEANLDVMRAEIALKKALVRQNLKV